jgi:hypothetical protein
VKVLVSQDFGWKGSRPDPLHTAEVVGSSPSAPTLFSREGKGGAHGGHEPPRRGRRRAAGGGPTGDEERRGGAEGLAVQTKTTDPRPLTACRGVWITAHNSSVEGEMNQRADTA